MYPSRFRYEAPRSLDEAIALLHDGGGEAKVLAGGQSLIPLLKLRFAAPELLVDINEICRASTTSQATPTARSASAPSAATPTSSTRRCCLDTADDGRGRSADRRPDRAQPRHARRLAVPRRPAG